MSEGSTGSSNPALDSSEAENGTLQAADEDVEIVRINRKYRQDSCRSWFVCFCASFNVALATGITFSYGVLMPVFMQYFRENREKTAWVGSLAMCSTFFFGTLVGFIIRRFGCRATCIMGGICCSAGLALSSLPDNMVYLFATYSLLFGFGCSCLFNSSFVVTSMYFTKRLSFATGIVTTGQSLGVFMFGPILQVLLDAYGWKRALQVTAGILALSCIVAITYSPDVEPSSVGPASAEDRTANPHIPSLDVPLYKNAVFVGITVSSAVCMFGQYVPQIHIVSYCQGLGISADDASKLYLLFGIGSSISRFATGMICEMKWVNPRWLYQFAEYTLGTAVILSPLAKVYPHIAAYFFFYGFLEGIFVATLNLHLLRCTVSEKKPLAFGISISFNSVFTASGPPVAGLIADKFNSYAPAFYTAGGVIVVGATLAFIIPLFFQTVPSGGGITGEEEEDATAILDETSETIRETVL